MVLSTPAPTHWRVILRGSRCKVYIFGSVYYSLGVLIWCEVVVLGTESGNSVPIVGSVISDRRLAHRLAVCPFCRAVFYSVRGFPRMHRVWNMCSVDEEHCDFHGKRLKFSSYGVDSLRVMWVCPKIVALSVLESGS